MESFRFDEAAAAADEALVLSRASRHAIGCAQSEVTARMIAYRRATPLRADLGWIDALAELNVAELEALTCTTEASFAFRAGDVELARDLALRAQRTWAAVGERAGGLLLVSALAIACTPGGCSPDEAAALGRRALECSTPGVGVQALGLLAPWLDAGALDAARVAALAAQVPLQHWHLRIDILSVDEALSRLRHAHARIRCSAP